MKRRVIIADHGDADRLAALLKVPLQFAADREDRATISLIRGMINKLQTKVSPNLVGEEVEVVEKLVKRLTDMIAGMSIQDRLFLERIEIALDPSKGIET